MVFLNDYGINIQSVDNIFVGNRSHNNTTGDYNYLAGNLYGQIIDGTAGGQITTTDPYANLRF